MLKHGKNIYIDCEWTLDQRIYLIGYAYDLSNAFQLYDYTINRLSFEVILDGIENIYCYGPDVGMLEKFFCMDLKNYYRCYNLLSVIKKIEPNLPSYRLCELEKMAGIWRETQEYKSNIFKAHKDWHHPVKRYFVMKYNQEDVLNLIRVKNYFFQQNGITRRDIDKWQME